MTTLAERALRYDREHARGLRALAYRMLGSRAEAEDIVQEAWLRWAPVDESTVQHAGAYLSRLVTNLCLDKLGSAAAKREQYVGVWLPEPLLDDAAGWSPGPEAQAEFAQDVSVAFLLALERLSPLERAAFLLHEVFDLDFDEIGRRLARSPAACRQLASRARNHVKADYARREVEDEERERLFGAFSEAVRNADVDALASVLADDAVMLADGGGKVSAVPRPLHGGALIARTFIGFATLPSSRGWRLVPARINGLPGCLVVDDATGRLVQTVALAPSATEPGRIGAVYIQRNPDKLRGVPAAPGTNASPSPAMSRSARPDRLQEVSPGDAAARRRPHHHPSTGKRTLMSHANAQPRLDPTQQSPELVRKLVDLGTAIADSGHVATGLLHLVDIRASQMNGCAFCLDMHVKEAKLHGERELRLYHVAIWRESPLFTPQERAVLAWTEALTRLEPTGISDALYAELREQFSERELSTLTFRVMTINAWNRLNVAFRTPPGVRDKAYGLDKAGLV